MRLSAIGRGSVDAKRNDGATRHVAHFKNVCKKCPLNGVVSTVLGPGMVYSLHCVYVHRVLGDITSY